MLEDVDAERMTHYMHAVSRLSAENAQLREQIAKLQPDADLGKGMRMANNMLAEVIEVWYRGVKARHRPAREEPQP